jgi:hypothetical protein
VCGVPTRPVLATTICAAAVAACGSVTAHGPAPDRSASDPPVAPRLSTAPAPCAVVVARTLHAVGARIEARAALHRRRPGNVPTLVARLTQPAPRTCGASSAATVADTVGAVARRLVAVEATAPETARALRLVARDRAFVGAVRRRDAAALRAAIVRFFRIKRLHIVRVRATTATGRLVGDVGGPYVIAPASRAIRAADGRLLGHVMLSVQDDAGYIKLIGRFTGAGVVLRMASRVVPGSSPAPEAIPARGTIVERGRREATYAFTTRAFPARRLHVALLVPFSGG